MAIINKGMSRRSFLGLTGSVAAVAGLGLTGCGGSSSDEGSASGSTDSANRGGGVITAGSAYAPSSFDPASTGSAVGLGANWHVIEGLYGIDYHDYSTFKELATDDPKSVDDTTFEVTIRKGAKFSDGTEVTADDVVASYTACAASATYAPFFQPFESIEAKDASTVTVKTKVPNFSLLKDRLAIVRVTPATQTEEDRAKQPIGSGPWMYDSISDTEITLVPNPEYNGEYAAEDKKIQYSILTDPTARVTAQQEGSTLVMELVTADAVRVTPATQTEEDRAKQPIGSGPWMYDSISDTEITLVPNPEYNGEYAAEDKKIQYSILTDPTARVTAQQEGSTLVMELVTADAVDQLESAGCKIDNVQGFGTRFIMFNVAKEPWNNVKVRQAVMYALDTEKMVSNTFAGLATAASCYLPKSFTNYHEASTVYKTDAKKAKKLIEESGITPGAITLRTTDNEQIKGMAAQVKNDLDALGFDVTIQTDTSPATYAAIDGGEAYDILLAPGDPSCFGADPDLLLNWWYGDNVWMQTRCPWKESAEWQKLHGLMDEALAAEGDEQQKKWNECFDIIADNAVLYPVVHVKTVSASWDDPSTAPNGEALDGFKGIGTTSMSFRGVATVKA